jgi:hypothetical protein
MGEVDLAWQLPVASFTDAQGGTWRKYAVCVRWELNPGSSTGRSRPYIYCNAAHPSVGIDTVRVAYTSGRLAIAPTQSWSPLASVNIQPDETFTGAGIAGGPSMSSEASVQLTQVVDGKVTALRADDPLLASLSLGNVWFSAESYTPPPACPPPPV